MKSLTLTPAGWPCKLSECPPGHFTYGEALGFKSDYKTPEGKIEAFNEGGDFFCPPEPRDDTMVQPVVAEWQDEEL